MSNVQLQTGLRESAGAGDAELERLLRAARRAVGSDVELVAVESGRNGRVVVALPFAVPPCSRHDVQLCFESTMPGCDVRVLDGSKVAIVGSAVA